MPMQWKDPAACGRSNFADAMLLPFFITNENIGPPRSDCWLVRDLSATNVSNSGIEVLPNSSPAHIPGFECRVTLGFNERNLRRHLQINQPRKPPVQLEEQGSLLTGDHFAEYRHILQAQLPHRFLNPNDLPGQRQRLIVGESRIVGRIVLNSC